MNNDEMKDENENLSYVELLKRLKHTEKKLKESSGEAERLKTIFLANISHEIRTPMNAILGFSGLLKDSNLSEEDKNSFIASISESCNNLLNTLDGIIQTAKIESKEISLKEEACDIHYLMNDLFASYNKYKKEIGKGHIEFRLKKEANGNPIMLTDISKLKQILSNLIDNALKFTESGYIEFGFELLDKDTIQFFVKDTGIGIPADNYNIIFDKFSQVKTHNSIKHNGLGVGLNISNNFVQQMGGNMGVRSRLSNGSEFYFSLPFIVAKKTPRKTNLDDNESDQSVHWFNEILKNSKDSKKKIEVYPNLSHLGA